MEKPAAEKKVVNGTPESSSPSGEPESEEKTNDKTNTSEPMDTSDSPPEPTAAAAAANDKPAEKESPPAKTTKLVTKQKKVELPIDAQVFQLSRTALTDYTEKEVGGAL